jgi:hypothetical protein
MVQARGSVGLGARDIPLRVEASFLFFMVRPAKVEKSVLAQNRKLSAFIL